jgi:esterase/lipase superfamily enzyme
MTLKMNVYRAWFGSCISTTILILSGCGSVQEHLVSSPNLYTTGIDPAPFKDTPEAVRSTTAKMLYVTDRVREDTTDGTLKYGHRRSNEAAYGFCEVEFTGPRQQPLTWEQLTQFSVSKKRPTRVFPHVTKVEQIGQVPSPRANKYERVGETWKISEAYKTAYRDESRKFNDLVSEYTKEISRKEAFVYVHGISTSFNQSARTMAQLWHMMGRQGVPIIYTWPSGHAGLLRGYNYDRESSEFTVLHFKTFLQVLAQNPDIEKINILAHSRGTDVTVSALRELHIYYEGREESTNEQLKLGQVILAAPDLDIQVLNQRFNRGGAYTGPDQITIYFSQTDKAIKASIWLFDSIYRLGSILIDKITPLQAKHIKELETMNAVEVSTKTKGIGHSYFIDDPATLSDVILVLRDGLEAGEENGRPLTPVVDGIWRLESGYPKSSPSQKHQ